MITDQHFKLDFLNTDFIYIGHHDVLNYPFLPLCYPMERIATGSKVLRLPSSVDSSPLLFIIES